MDLPFKAENLCHLHVHVPTQPNLAPPGWYMLFLVNHAGIPSVAKWVHLTGGRRPKHDPAPIKEWIDMRMTGRERPVSGTKAWIESGTANCRNRVMRLGVRAQREGRTILRVGTGCPPLWPALLSGCSDVS